MKYTSFITVQNCFQLSTTHLTQFGSNVFSLFKDVTAVSNTGTRAACSKIANFYMNSMYKKSYGNTVICPLHT